MEVSEILEQVDILEYISQYCDFEEKNGEHWALSPFKDENTPSFSVSTEKQMFYDFSSGYGGNLIHFIQKYHKCNFKKALDMVKSYAGITEESENQIVRLISTSVAKKFKDTSRELKEVKYKPLPPGYMDKFSFNTKKMQSWIDEGIELKALQKYGVKYDDFSNRIVYPITDINGQIINVSGRILDKDYKEKCLRKYTYFQPLGVLDTLYGLSLNIQTIKKRKEIIIFEGAKSVMKADGWGYDNCAALLTSHLNPMQMLILVKLGVRVVFALDEDIDIRQDMQIQKLKRYVKIEWVRNRDNLLGEKMAPVDAGRDVWEKLYERRIAIN